MIAIVKFPDMPGMVVLTFLSQIRFHAINSTYMIRNSLRYRRALLKSSVQNRLHFCVLPDHRIDHADSCQNISGILRVPASEFDMNIHFLWPEKTEKSFQFMHRTKKSFPVHLIFNKRFQPVLFLSNDFILSQKLRNVYFIRFAYFSKRSEKDCFFACFFDISFSRIRYPFRAVFRRFSSVSAGESGL